VAETVAPSVRGRQRMQVVSVLATSATATGALAGFVLGVVLGVPARLAGVPVVVGAVVLLDLAGVRPLAVGRQVPRTWTRAFSLPTAALLYGARLGVGPLTVLNTWLWWGAAVLGAAAGVWWSTVVGAVFGLTRVLVMVASTRGVEVDMPGRMARLRGGERLVRLSAAALALAFALVACNDDEHRASTPTTTSPTNTPAPTVPPVVVDEGVLLADAGPGFTRVPDDDRPGLGPLDLAAAAKAEADTSAERALLETRRFRGGRARAWRAADGDEAYAAVYEFADAAGAAAYLQDGLVTLEGRGAARYAVEEVADATGFSQAERRATGAVTSHGVVFTRGARFFLVVVATARPDSTPGQAAALARAADARQRNVVS
jgi:hypothetical protein